MNRQRFWRIAAGLALLMVLLPAADAYAAIPAVVGPLQALIAIAPQLLAMLGAALLALTKPETYRAGARFLWHQKFLCLGLVAGCVLAGWGLKRLFGGSVGEAAMGSAWGGMRGGPQRLGALPGQKGPGNAARVLWRYAGKSREQVDSSPAVVGNRVYYSSAVLGLFGGSTVTGAGTIYCRDTDGGGEVWSYDGAGMGQKLTSVFSSPALGGDIPGTEGKGPGGGPAQGRYLVCGEGYHQDQESRFFCLDLLKGKPELVWFKQATSHVESSPCIHKCADGVLRAFVGAGDDGVWAVEVEFGKVSWKLEGTPAFYIHKDCPQLEEVRALTGRKVAITGTVKRLGGTMTDPGQVLFTEIESVVPCDEAPEPFVGEGFRRTVFGTVEVGEVPTVDNGDGRGGREPLAESSSVALRMPEYYLDVESSPTAVDFPVDPAKPEGEQRSLLFFGTGLGGRSGVACVDACTGKAVWFKQVPNPVFSAPAVLKGLELPDKRIIDLLVFGYGEGDFVSTAAKPGYIMALNLSAIGQDGVPEEYFIDKQDPDKKAKKPIETGNTILGAVAVDKGEAYACARDGALYVVDLKAGALKRKVPLGGSLVCAPAVTDDAVYVLSLTGMAYCVDRRSLAVRWKKLVMSCGNMYSSPVAAGGKLFVGTPGQGMCCLEDDPDAATRPPAPWCGAGGTAARSGEADEGGLPVVDGDQAPRRWKELAAKGLTVPGPLAGCGGRLYVQLRRATGETGAAGEEAEPAADAPVELACVDAENGSVLWSVEAGGPVTALAAAPAVGPEAWKQDGDHWLWALSGENGREQILRLFRATRTGASQEWKSSAVYLRGILSLGRGRVVVADGSGLVCLSADDRRELWRSALPEVSGAPVLNGGLVIAAVGGDKPMVVCLDDGAGRPVWSADLPAEPVGPPACAAGVVAVACGVRGEPEGVKGQLLCLRLTSGLRLWKADLPALPIGYPVMDDRYVLVAAADGKLHAFEALPVDESKLPRPPEEVKPPVPVDKELSGQERALAEARWQKEKEAYDEYISKKMEWWKNDVGLKATDTFDPRPVRAGGYEIGQNPQPPALAGGVAVYVGYQRAGAWNLAASTWPWQFYERKLMGAVLSPPVVMGETVFIATEKRGLVGIGEHRVIAALRRLKDVRVGKEESWKLAERFRTEKKLQDASVEEISGCLPEDAGDLGQRIHEALHKDDLPGQKEAAK